MLLRKQKQKQRLTESKVTEHTGDRGVSVDTQAPSSDDANIVVLKKLAGL